MCMWSRSSSLQTHSCQESGPWTMGQGSRWMMRVGRAHVRKPLEPLRNAWDAQQQAWMFYVALRLEEISSWFNEVDNHRPMMMWEKGKQSNWTWEAVIPGCLLCLTICTNDHSDTHLMQAACMKKAGSRSNCACYHLCSGPILRKLTLPALFRHHQLFIHRQDIPFSESAIRRTSLWCVAIFADCDFVSFDDVHYDEMLCIHSLVTQHSSAHPSDLPPRR